MLRRFQTEIKGENARWWKPIKAKDTGWRQNHFTAPVLRTSYQLEYRWRRENKEGSTDINWQSILNNSAAYVLTAIQCHNSITNQFMLLSYFKTDSLQYSILLIMTPMFRDLSSGKLLVIWVHSWIDKKPH